MPVLGCRPSCRTWCRGASAKASQAERPKLQAQKQIRPCHVWSSKRGIGLGRVSGAGTNGTSCSGGGSRHAQRHVVPQTKITTSNLNHGSGRGKALGAQSPSLTEGSVSATPGGTREFGKWEAVGASSGSMEPCVPTRERADSLSKTTSFFKANMISQTRAFRLCR